MDFDPVAYYHVAYARHHIMNPLEEKRLLSAAALCAPQPGGRVLDIGSGKGWASLLLAQEWGCHATLVDPSPRWTAEARELFDGAGLSANAEIHEMEATQFAPEDGIFDIVLCLGTTPVYGGFRSTVEALLPALAPGGTLIVGEPTIDVPVPKRFSSFLKEWGWEVPTMRQIMRDCAALGIELLCSLRSTREEWDTYMNLQWLALLDHARANPDNAQAQDFLEWMRDEQEVYLRYQRQYMDWTLMLLRADA
jgi:SAM-dependent methyltransferase